MAGEDFDTFLKRMYDEQKAKALCGKDYLLALAPKLAEKGVTKVVCHYDGNGDSGQIESIDAYLSDLTSTSLDAVISEGEGGASVEESFYNILEDKQPGWEINEGSFGDIVFHVSDEYAKANGSPVIVLEHNVRIEDSEYSETEI